MNDLTYFESLKVMRFMQWRLFLILFIPALIIALTGIRIDQPVQQLITGLSGFVIMPIIFKLAIRKHYEGFRFQVVRAAHHVTATCSGE